MPPELLRIRRTLDCCAFNVRGRLFRARPSRPRLTERWCGVVRTRLRFGDRRVGWRPVTPVNVCHGREALLPGD